MNHLSHNMLGAVMACGVLGISNSFAGVTAIVSHAITAGARADAQWEEESSGYASVAVPPEGRMYGFAHCWASNMGDPNATQYNQASADFDVDLWHPAISNPSFYTLNISGGASLIGDGTAEAWGSYYGVYYVAADAFGTLQTSVVSGYAKLTDLRTGIVLQSNAAGFSYCGNLGPGLYRVELGFDATVSGSGSLSLGMSIPAPGSLALLGLAGVVACRRR